MGDGRAALQPDDVVGEEDEGTMPEGSGAEEAAPSGQEPINLHGLPHHLYDEVLHRTAAKAVVHLNAGDGTLAERCLEAGIPYFGFVHTAEHARHLMKHLTKMVFAMFRDDTSKLHDPDLAAAVGDDHDGVDGDSKPLKGKGKTTPKKKSVALSLGKNKEDLKGRAKQNKKSSAVDDASMNEDDEEEDDENDHDDEDDDM